MAQFSFPATVRQPVQAVVEKASRLYFIDYLRAALIILVVLHHLAQVYAGIPPFYYYESAADSPVTGLVGLAFVLFNQAWFMGALFLLAGYFTPGSFERKGAGSFLKDRLIRLGVPLVVFVFVLNPISLIGWFLMPAGLTGNVAGFSWASFWQAYPELIGLGPLWFVALLLIFSFGYAGWWWLTRNRPVSPVNKSTKPGYLAIGLFIVALALASYLVRIVIPIGRSVLDFPTLAYLPEYLSFFVIGVYASRRNWFRSIPNSMGIAGFLIAIVATVFLFTIGFLSFLKAIETGNPEIPPFGYGTWQSAVYALWDATFAVGMMLAAITFFRRFFSTRSRFGNFLAQQSYAVYIIHVPIIVFSAYALRGIEWGPALKYGLLAAIVLPVSFVAAYLLRQIPGVSRIL